MAPVEISLWEKSRILKLIPIKRSLSIGLYRYSSIPDWCRAQHMFLSVIPIHCSHLHGHTFRRTLNNLPLASALGHRRRKLIGIQVGETTKSRDKWHIYSLWVSSYSSPRIWLPLMKAAIAVFAINKTANDANVNVAAFILKSIYFHSCVIFLSFDKIKSKSKFRRKSHDWRGWCFTVTFGCFTVTQFATTDYIHDSFNAFIIFFRVCTHTLPTSPRNNNSNWPHPHTLECKLESESTSVSVYLCRHSAVSYIT